MGIDIQGEGPQAGGQQVEKGLEIGQSLGQGQVEQHCPRRRHESRCGLGRRGFAALGEGGVQLPQGEPRPLDAAQGEVGVGVEQAGGQPRPRVGAVEIGLGFLRCYLRLAGEIVVLCQCNVPLCSLCHGLRRLPAAARREGGIHQGHEIFTDCQERYRLRLSRPGVLRLFRVGGDGPGSGEFPGAGNAPRRAQLLHRPFGQVPSVGNFLRREILHGRSSQNLLFDFHYMRSRA